MAASATRRVVVVTRPSVYEKLIQRHATLGQVRFFLESRGQSLDDVLAQHQELENALHQVERAIPADWRRSRAKRSELDRFLFEPDDIVIAVGQDGLVANVAKYLENQPVIGINPSVGHNPGVLVPHQPDQIAELLAMAGSDQIEPELRTMVEARLDDGQRIVGLNEIFIGHQTHQSARYRIFWENREERQSSSGLIIATGTGATGWAKSIHQERHSPIHLPKPTDAALVFFTREAWPSIATGTTMTEGVFSKGEQLRVVSEMEIGGVIFGDGIEADRIEWLWGQRVEIAISKTTLHLVK